MVKINFEPSYIFNFDLYLVGLFVDEPSTGSNAQLIKYRFLTISLYHQRNLSFQAKREISIELCFKGVFEDTK